MCRRLVSWPAFPTPYKEDTVTRTSLFAAIAAAALATLAPAHAAEESAPTLRVDSGSVMTSTGGEFVTAASGTPVIPGTRVMLAEGSSASLVYANGCTASIAAAGVHAVPAVCQAAGSQTAFGTAASAGVDWASAGWLFLGTAVVAGGLASMDTESAPPPPPVSR